jgi:hypothetical protein
MIFSSNIFPRKDFRIYGNLFNDLKKMNKNLFLLSLVFFFTFFGFGSVQQYLTSFFIDI